MKGTKEWKVSVIAYPKHKPKHKHLYHFSLRGPNEQKIRRKLLDTVYAKGLFVSEFIDIEGSKK